MKNRHTWEEKQRRKSANKHQTSHLDHRETQDETSDENDTYMFYIESKIKSALYPIKIGTQKVNLLIDSGFTLNILDEQQVYHIDPTPVLHMSNAKIFHIKHKNS